VDFHNSKLVLSGEGYKLESLEGEEGGREGGREGGSGRGSSKGMKAEAGGGGGGGR
jgi:hypothetical protein